MNPISESIRFIKDRIPREILDAAFSNRGRSFGRLSTSNTSEDLIRNFIYTTILPDCNMSGGISKTIDLSSVRPKEGYDELIYIIPPELTDGKRIVSVSSVSISPPNPLGSKHGFGATSRSIRSQGAQSGGNYCEQSSSPLMKRAEQALNSAQGNTKIPYFTNTNVDIVGNNSIRVTNYPQNIIYQSLTCFLEYGENMNEISARSIPDFRRLCLYGAERYIYNTLVIDIDKDEIHMGSNLGVFKRTIEEYKDSADDYDDWLENTMGTVLFINDDTRYDEFLDSMMQPIY